MLALFDELLGLWGNVLVLFGSLAVLAKASDVAINNSVKIDRSWKEQDATDERD